MSASVASFVFSFLILVVCVFQVCLSMGAPWGHLAMGGRFPGKLPKRMRVAALVQVAVLLLAGLFIAIRADLALPNLRDLSVFVAWCVVVLMSLSLIMNLATKSRVERLIWAPVAALMLACSIVVATS